MGFVKGGTVFGPQPRSYEYQLPRKVEKGALRAALMEKMQSGAMIVVNTSVNASAPTTPPSSAATCRSRRGERGPSGTSRPGAAAEGASARPAS